MPDLLAFALHAISPIDGRYASKTLPLQALTSEAALMRYRVRVECAWFAALHRAQLPGMQAVPTSALLALDDIWQNFNEADAATIKAFEHIHNHDVKAVEYFIKQKLTQNALLNAFIANGEFVHFACTSEDINNCAYALMLKEARNAVLLPIMSVLCDELRNMAHEFAQIPMLCRTHGQTATPSTVGKELAVFVHRLSKAKAAFAAVTPLAKLNGAVGNYNAHQVAYPTIDWPEFSRQVLENTLGLTQNPYTIQIEPHDWMAEYFNALAQFNTILIDLDRDIWGYISLGYFKQNIAAQETGSSTMPHKVNPIDFENSEGNLGIANALLRHFAEKLPISRWQRDLSDSTVLRNVGVALAHSLLAYEMTRKGLGKLRINPQRLQEDLDHAWEVLGEAVQTVLRRHGFEKPYEYVKEKTRGKDITAEVMRQMIAELPLAAEDKAILLALSPATYTAYAAQLAQTV